MNDNAALSLTDFQAALDDLNLQAAEISQLSGLADLADSPSSNGANAPAQASGVLLGPLRANDLPSSAADWESQLSGKLGSQGAVLIFFPQWMEERELARWRNALWPWLHAVCLYRTKAGKTVRSTQQGDQALQGNLREGTLYCFRRRSHVLSPEATVEKFDQNSGGWNGEPGSPGYPHYRWMRRYVGLYAKPENPRRILDFGSGAGWVGIETSQHYPDAHLAFFDPSPEMVKNAEQNARNSGCKSFEGRTGFGEDPPFPAEGEEPFDLVISSGVISFSPDFPSWYDGIVRATAPGGTVVVGDIHRKARGFRGRRQRKALLPVREMNALTREEVRAELEQRGLTFVRHNAYQLTWPIPQAMHLSEAKLKGLLSRPLLWSNQIASTFDRTFGSPSPDQFDSWVIEFKRN